MKNLKCAVVDDEPLAQNLIEKFIKRVPYLSLMASYDDAINAMECISIVDIVFLDVNMPEMSGIEFLRCLTTKRPYVVITTAYPDYALEGFELNVVDYLIKPIAFGRFMKALNKIIERIPEIKDIKKDISVVDSTLQANAEKNQLTKEINKRENFFFIRADKKLLKVKIEEIIFVEGMKDYVKIHLIDEYIMAHITMTKILELLPNSLFIRINRSFIVQINCIKCIVGNMVETSNGHKLSIGTNYRDTIRYTLKGWTI